jgi:PleD family two-component response regulator
MNGTGISLLATSVPQGGAVTPQRAPELHDQDEETMITLLLVDDEPLVRQGLHTWLERVGDIRVIGEASNGTEAIALAQALHPDVVLMDISMPTRDGSQPPRRYAHRFLSVRLCSSVSMMMRPCEHERMQPER